jgi:uncharacterized membrane protein YqaE (UPF0057 family)
MRKILVLFTASVIIISSSLTTYAASSVVPPPGSVPGNTEIKAAIAELKNVSKKEKKERTKKIKSLIKSYKADKKAGKEASTNTLLLVILAILLPPLAVYLHEGTINNRFWISLLLTILFWLPGVIYALIVILGDE